MIDFSEIEPYLAELIADVLGAGGVVGGVRIGGGLWIGAVDQAPDVGDLYLEGSIRHSQAVAARLSLAAAWSCPDNAWTAIPWDTADLNETGMWDVSTPETITCLVDGLYLVNLNVIFAMDATGYRVISIRRNGTGYMAKMKEFNLSATVADAMSVSVLLELKVGDTIEGMAFQNSGAGLNVGGAAEVETNIGVVRIA